MHLQVKYLLFSCPLPLLLFFAPLARGAGDGRGELLQPADCENFLLGATGRQLSGEVRERLRQLDGFAFDLYSSLPYPIDGMPLPSPTQLLRADPAAAFDTEDLLAFWREERARDENQPLPVLAAAALGIDEREHLRFGEVSRVLAIVERGYLHLQTETFAGRIVGRTEVPLTSLALGFPPTLLSWQDGRLRVDARGYRRRARAVKVSSFLREEGVALLILDRGRVRFGYRIDLEDLFHREPGNLLAVDLVTVTNSARRPLGPAEHQYPTAASRGGLLNLRATTAGIELLGINATDWPAPF